MLALIAPLVLKALVGAGLSEALAGRFVISKVFGILMWIVLSLGLTAGAVWGVPAIAAHHDAKVARAAAEKVAAEFKRQSEVARLRAVEEALAERDQTLTERQGDMEAQRTEIERLKKEKHDALEASRTGDATAVHAGDPWLRQRAR